MSNQEKQPETISDQLRAIIKARGLTAYALAKLSGVNTGVIQRFINEERDIRLASVDKLATALGLRLCQDRDDAK
jgi:transcriptional regulator with XRE-family HTH domain